MSLTQFRPAFGVLVTAHAAIAHHPNVAFDQMYEKSVRVKNAGSDGPLAVSALLALSSQHRAAVSSALAVEFRWLVGGLLLAGRAFIDEAVRRSRGPAYINVPRSVARPR